MKRKNKWKRLAVLPLVILILTAGCRNRGPEAGSSSVKQTGQEGRTAEAEIQESVRSASGAGSSSAAENIGPDEASGGVTVGVTLASEKAPYQTELGQVMEDTAKSRNVELIVEYAGWSEEVQNSQMEAFIDQDVDAIIAAPVHSKALLNSLRKAYQAGIPVVDLNMKVDSASSRYISSYVGSSSEEEGTLMAELAAKLMPDGGNIAIIEGAPGSDPQIYRTRYFMNRIKDFSNMNVIDIRNGRWNRDTAKKQAYQILETTPNLDMIYCHDTTMAYGAAEAAEELGRENQVLVIGIGAVDPDSIDAVRNKMLAGMVTQSSKFEGTAAVLAADQAARGQTLRPWVMNPSEILTAKNIKEYTEPVPDSVTVTQ